MINISFNGLYKLRTYSNKSDVGRLDQIQLRDHLKAEFDNRNIETSMEIEIHTEDEDEIKGTPCTLSLISYGTPEEDYEVLQKVLGKKLVPISILDKAKELFTAVFMEDFKAKTKELLDKHLESIDKHIKDEKFKQEQIKKANDEVQYYGLSLEEFDNNAIDIEVGDPSKI